MFIGQEYSVISIIITVAIAITAFLNSEKLLKNKFLRYLQCSLFVFIFFSMNSFFIYYMLVNNLFAFNIHTFALISILMLPSILLIRRLIATLKISEKDN
ncbi:hypothetical protein SAMN04487944_12222 [Gracilibacillus ureilyticus]|uniref:Uncharacterized protein n=1 Tax=Gracilibacillus ureilyticus TaxID=531814 RepID=A0A1H9V9W2_9BACI|nr:hypothetical protein [Gracilibacillus ureilyticus]SES18017.1 hypothetical protein SAMN04487944_12222 [Gracilibacillus ureilyticus]